MTIFFNCDSLYALQDSHYEAWSYKKKKHKKIKTYVQEICLQKTGRLKVSDSRLKVFFIIGQKKAFNGQMGREFQSCTRKEIIDISILITSRNGD